MNHLDTLHPKRHYAKVLITNKDWDVLLLNHSHITRPWLMLPWWECELWETPLVALKRELWEELIAAFSFDKIQFVVNQILQLPNEEFFRYGSLYYLPHAWDISIRESEQEKFWKSPVWISRTTMNSCVSDLSEANRLMILQILRISENNLSPQINVMKIK